MSLAAIGDIHYEKLSHRIPNFNGYVSKTLRSTFEDALDRGVEAFVIAGDIFDTPYPSQASQVEFINVATDYDIPMYVIRGNHDYADATTDSLATTRFTRRKFKSNIRVIDKPKIIKIGGINYHFMPHPFVEDMSHKADFAIAHFAVNGAKGDNGFKVKTKNQPRGNFILGDFHEEQSGKVKDCLYEYIGSLTQLSWQEKPYKSYLLVEDGIKHRRKIDLAYKLINKTVSSDEELNELTFKKDSFYYLRTANGYLLPKGWALDHPEVVRQMAIARKKDKRAAAFEVASQEINHKQYLVPYLHQKKYSPAVIARAEQLVETLQVRS